MILIAYSKNKKCLEYLIEGRDEITHLYESTIACSSDSSYNEDADNHDEHSSYKVVKWLFHTDLPIGIFKQLRTLPFGFIAENKKEREIFIVFRGTITTEEWKNNFSAHLSQKYPGSSELGLIHAGFNTLFTSSYYDRIKSRAGLISRASRRVGLYADPKPEHRSSIRQDLNNYIINRDWHREGYKIFITGHSLGGALAMLAGQYLLSEDFNAYKSIVSICTFGSPRTGNNGFAKWFSEVDVVRYVNSEDIVPTVPPSTTNLLGEDMNEFHDGKIKAERAQGFANVDKIYAIREGGVTSNSAEVQSTNTLQAFVHVGTTRTFTSNRGSISYNHNLKDTYRSGIYSIG